MSIYYHFVIIIKMTLNRMKGLAVSTLWVYTIFAGFFLLYAPLLPLVLLNHDLYRVLADYLFSLWQLYPVALFQCMARCDVHCYGDQVDSNESCIIIANHRTRLDWNYIWIVLYHAQRNSKQKTQIDSQNIGHAYENSVSRQKWSAYYEKFVKCFIRTAKLKYVLKDEIKFIPAIGWIMQMNQFLFLKRRWDKDAERIEDFTRYYREIQAKMGYKYQVMIFPEGTNLCPDTRAHSSAFAAKRGLEDYDHVLHPRTRGFTSLCARMREAGLTAVYDMTLAYDDPPNTELDLLRGNLPSNIYVRCRRYSATDLPEDEVGLAEWLRERWREKEKILERFHRHGDMGVQITKSVGRPLGYALLVFFFWTAIDISLLLAVYFFPFVCYWIVYNSLLFSLLTKINGLQKLQKYLLEKSNRVF